jgi:molybdate transport repressor ModE-like protein
MLYDTTLLRTFVAICDCGSFTKAAREVNLTQSAVSLHVKRLEDQVGVRLVVRNAHGVRITEPGEVLQSYARRILALYKEAEQRLGRNSEVSVRIGEYFDLHTLSSLLRQFSSHYPSIRLQVELGIGPDISALVDEGELDWRSSAMKYADRIACDGVHRGFEALRGRRLLAWGFGRVVGGVGRHRQTHGAGEPDQNQLPIRHDCLPPVSFARRTLGRAAKGWN